MLQPKLLFDVVVVVVIVSLSQPDELLPKGGGERERGITATLCTLSVLVAAE